MNVMNVGKPSWEIQPSHQFQRERNRMNVMYVENCSLTWTTIPCIIEVTQKRSPMDVVNVGKPSPIIPPSFDIREYTQARNPMSVMSVESSSLRNLTLKYIIGFIQERNPMNVVNAEKSSLECQILLCTIEAIRERSPMNVMSVGKYFLRSHTSLYIIELIQERNPMNVMDVGKNSTTDQLLTAIRESTVEEALMCLMWKISYEIKYHFRNL